MRKAQVAWRGCHHVVVQERRYAARMHGTPCVNESVRQLVVVNAQVGRRQTTVSQGGVSHIRGGIAWGEKGEKERGKREKKKSNLVNVLKNCTGPA